MFWYSSAAISIHVEQMPTLVEHRRRFWDEADLAVAVGTAPDGLPLILKVRRSVDVISGILDRLTWRRDRLPGTLGKAVNDLEVAVNAEFRRDGIVSVDDRKGYLASTPIGELFGATLLSNAIGAHSPLLLPEDYYSGGLDPERIPQTAVGAQLSRLSELRQMMGAGTSQRRLYVPVPEGRPLVVETSEVDGYRPRKPRPLVYESLKSLQGVRAYFARYYDAPVRDNSQLEFVDLDCTDIYVETLSRNRRVAWLVPRQSLAQVLVQVARGLQPLHDAGLVHGDLKPDNILITEVGGRAFDPLELKAGELSTTCTPGWASPEQVVVRPVCPQSDVYALGLMLASLVQAAIFGEMRNFTIPTGGSERKRMTLLAEPDVFLDPINGLQLDDDARRAYADLIKRCLAFEPERRPADGASFATELEELLERHPLPTTVPIHFLAGILSRNVNLLGRVGPAWIMSDHRRSPY